MTARKFVIVPVSSGYPFFHGIDLSDFNGIRSKYHRKINLASRGSMTSDIRIDFTQQIIDKLGGLPRCTRFATRTVPYGRDFEAEFTQTSVAVVHGGSQQIGQRFAALPGVHAMTDVTGFGLAGHLLEMCEGSGVSARLDFKALPLLDEVDYYLSEGCVPGGTLRNFDSYGDKLGAMDDRTRSILCDPQTSGGLLVAVGKESEAELLAIAAQAGLTLSPIGQLQARTGNQFIEVVQ